MRRIATSERIAICGARVYGDPSVVTEELDDGTRTSRWTGLILCNRSGCPVCGAAKVRKFRQQVLRTLQAQGYWQHVVCTVSHHQGESWERVYDRVMDGLRGITKGQVGRLVRDKVLATIRATESTWSAKNGWHVHLHVLWKLSRPLLDEEKALVKRQWAASVDANYQRGVTFGALFHCLREEDRLQAASYLSKLALELSGASKSTKPGHYNLGELYHQAANGQPIMQALIREYQRCTKGKRLYQLDRRSKLLHDAAPELEKPRVVRSWITPVHRLEFRELVRGERGGEPLAAYLPLEMAVGTRGDPTDAVLDVIYSIAGFG